MSKRKRRSKWGKVNISGKKNIEEVASSFIRYMELAVAARKYLKATKRFNSKVDFRLYIEAEFCSGAIEFFFRMSKSFVAGVQQTVHSDKEAFKEEVKKFSDSIIPEQPTLITKNLEGVMGQIIQRDKALERGKKIII